MKSPSFSFYSADFLIGCFDLTNEEIGIYIKLLCFQHQKGHLTQKQIGLFLGCSFDSLSEELKSKFKIDENGMIFNARLEREIEKRSQFVDKQRENGKRGGAPKGNQNAKKQPKNNPDDNPKTTQNNPLENENEIEYENEIEIEKGGMGEKTEETFCEVLNELDFENVWLMYERKGNKKTSKQKWEKLKQKDKQLAVVHIPKYVHNTPEIKYRKNFETYINQEAWNDEIICKNGNNQQINQTIPMGTGNPRNGVNTGGYNATDRRKSVELLKEISVAILQQPDS